MREKEGRKKKGKGRLEDERLKNVDYLSGAPIVSQMTYTEQKSEKRGFGYW